ncbi:hypothetical protein DPEC_G00256140 [Dallia pectoralis]|uniref:Uncharacterized protein n=1 Tax=Dallia pectoralis TaxID=75939 RepID=A0ACC2FUS4_DALPE|nr:hypothetical protein DPEC_G00256140 [Dallia pectoralis]
MTKDAESTTQKNKTKKKNNETVIELRNVLERRDPLGQSMVLGRTRVLHESECYGTEEDDYAEAVPRIVSCGSKKFLVGVCSVFGVAPGEVYPESRKEFILGNEVSYSDACHPQPGKAVSLHNVKTVIGRVKIRPSRLVTLEERSVVVDAPAENTNKAVDDSSESIAETVRSLRKAVQDQAAETQVLKNVLEAIKVQNSVLTQRLNCPDDPDVLFTLQGAKDFTRRTGVKTKLCAGTKPTDGDINAEATDPIDDTPVPRLEHMDDTMSVTQTQIDNLIKLLQQQPHLHQQQHHLQTQAQLHPPQSFPQLAPLRQHFMQPPTPHLWNPQQQTEPGFYGGQAHNSPSGVMVPSDKSPQYAPLMEEQKRKIAIEYNKEESARQAASQKDQDRMLDSIKASIRDVMLEQPMHGAVSQVPSRNQAKRAKS